MMMKELYDGAAAFDELDDDDGDLLLPLLDDMYCDPPPVDETLGEKYIPVS